MKKSGVLLLAVLSVVFMLGFVFSLGFIFNLNLVSGFDIDIHNFTFQESYSPYQLIGGEVNLTISEADFNALMTSNLDVSLEISLEDFLDDNGGDYDCTPMDCSNDYSFSNSVVEKTFRVGTDVSYVGFVLNGNGIEVTGLSFELESDFGQGTQLPLRMEFFEADFWEYAEFSEEYATADYGCYSQGSGAAGPLIRTSKYCEEIEIPETNSLEIGALVDDDDTKSLKMTVYSDLVGASLGQCEFNPTVEEGCKVYADTGDTYSEGDYYICVSAVSGETTDYHLYSESSGTNCGFVYSSSSESTKDYGIFASAAMYEAAKTGGVNNLQISAEEFNDFSVYANEVVNERYGGDCSDGCVLPVGIVGVAQNLKIKNLVLDYSISGEGDMDPDDKIYDLDVVPALVDFSGVLDFELLDVRANPGDDEFILYLDGDELFSADIEILPAPIIRQIAPRYPPAGVPVTFYASVDYNGTIDSYVWDFGDGTSETTVNRTVVHTYDEITNYTLELEVFAKNLSNSASVTINAVSPQEAINVTLDEKNGFLDEAVKKINKFPVWHQEALKEAVEIDYYRDELQRLEKDFNDAFEDSEYVDIALELYDLDVPVSVSVIEQTSGPLLTELDDIDPLPVQMIGGGSEEDLEVYQDPILRWQIDNIASDILFKRIVMVSAGGEIEDVMMVYSVDVSSSAGEESFFVIDKNVNGLFFKGNVRARGEGDASVIVINEGETKSFSFYYLADVDLEESVMFVSPKLSHLVLEPIIDESCDYDNVCEAGEDSSSCRSDCKPIVGMILWMVGAFVFVLILYTLMQVWYKSKYEKSLFKDRRQLYNLLMFIVNARTRGMSDGKIRSALRKSKWSGERIAYALKKSRGERTGMYEIIPVEKIFARWRQKKADRNFVTGNMQQDTQNINKPLMRR
ncbi:hypothetical protein CMI37_10400 [Candidatus Pacearchaeota archaeon]|nr:hypothetical protein [Candidatus Pacearchaeota archaeon]